MTTFGSIKQDLTRLRAHVAKQEEPDDALALLDETLAEADDEPIEGTEAKVLEDCLSKVLPLVDEGNTTEMNRWNRLEASSKVGGKVKALYGVSNA